MDHLTEEQLGGHSKRGWFYIAAASVTLSIFAFGIVSANLAAGATRSVDEDAWAHLFQLAMVLQVPLMLLFLAMADWTQRKLAVLLIAAQIAGAAVAFAALAWSGY